MLDPYEILKANPKDAAKYYYKHGKPEQLKKTVQEYETSRIGDPEKAYWYAQYVVKGRWPKAESYIMKDPEWAYWYAQDVIKDRWSEAEPYIMRDPQWDYHYAKDIIKGRWPEAERYIMKDPYWSKRYQERHGLHLNGLSYNISKG